MKVIIFMVLMIFIVVIMVIVNERKNNYNIDSPPISAARVTLYGCRDNKGDGWGNIQIKNSNTFDVRIRRVEQERRFRAAEESTISMRRLRAGEQLEESSVTHMSAFYIYTTKGGMIGFLSAGCDR